MSDEPFFRYLLKSGLGDSFTEEEGKAKEVALRNFLTECGLKITKTEIPKRLEEAINEPLESES